MPAGSLDLLDLLEAGNFDARTAALCWLVVERHGSVIVAAGPQRAGKTTTLEAFLECAPEGTRRIDLRGLAETFDFVPRVNPASTILVASEISDHLPMYIWGAPARRAFSLLRDGFALAATLHADSVPEAIGILTDDLGAESTDVARVDLIAVLRVFRTPDGPARRLVALSRLATRGGRAVREIPLVALDPKTQRLVHDDDAEASRVDAGELAKRTAYLEELHASGAKGAHAAIARHLALGGRTA